MGVRNCADIGENLQKIIKLLMKNQTLLRLLYYTDKDPLLLNIAEVPNIADGHPDITSQVAKDEIYEKLIKVIPKVTANEIEKSIISIRVTRAPRNSANNEFKTVYISIDSFVPLKQWIIKNENLRPFLIMGEIQNSLVGKSINGLGKISGGDFELSFLTDEVSCYQQTFIIESYD
jgi:hypothetical protein